MKRILLIGTHPNQNTGYASVMHNIIQYLSQNNTVIVFGFQAGSDPTPEYNSNVIVQSFQDFGIQNINALVKLSNPDTIILYNDPCVISNFLVTMQQIDHPAKKIAYLDIVYPFVKKSHIDTLNENCDIVCTFLEAWKTELETNGITKPIYVISHGLDSDIVNIEKETARKQLNIAHDGPLLLNMNKNVPRKRYDVFFKGLSDFFTHNPASKLRVIIGTFKNGSWDLDEMIERLYPNIGDKIEFLKDPHNMTKKTVNLLYNACEFGINVCDGEGFGLCNYEHFAVGGRQILTDLKVFREIYGDNATYIDVKCEYHSDNMRDSIGGIAKIADYEDMSKKLSGLLTDQTVLFIETKYNYTKEIEKLEALC